MRTWACVLLALLVCGLAGMAQGKSVKEPKAKKQKALESRVDARQDRQERRIDHGIKKGYLTPDEIAKLDAQQKSIADLESSLKSDGKLSKDDFKQLKDALDTASRCIWGEKHDTEGNQMPVYRLGKNVFARDFLTAKMQDENLSGAEAKALLKDFHRAVTLKRRLATEDLPAAQRDKLQAEFNDLVNQYFVVR